MAHGLQSAVDEEYWRTRAGVLLTILRSERARKMYARTRTSGFYTADFAAWLDGALAEKYGSP